MAKNNQGTEISVKDTVTIRGARGSSGDVTGEVISADWYEETGWYIELIHAGGYGYWKQRDDGGQVIAVNGSVL